MTGSRSQGAAFRWPGSQRLPVIALLLVLIPASGCRMVGTADPAPAAAPVEVAAGPAIEDGVSDAATDRETARLLSEGEELLRAERASEAREQALTIEERYPTAEGSGLALWLRARASADLEDWSDAEEAARRYTGLVDEDGPFHGEATLLQARARWEGGLGGGIESLFAVSADADDDVLAEAEELAAAWAAELDTSVLRDLATEAPPHPRVLPPFLVELAVRRDLSGARSEAEELAERALSLSPGPEVAERARAVVDGTIGDELEIAAVIGVILPDSGPPSLLQLAREIEEGVETAIAVEERDARFPVRLVRVVEGSGNQAELIRAVQELERAGVAAAVGPLMDPILQPAARARSGALPMLSPTSRTVPEGEAGVFSLTAADPEAGRALARLVLDRGPSEVILVHSSAPDVLDEVQWFRETFEAGDGLIAETFSYPAGATNFEWPLSAIAEAAGVLDDPDDLDPADAPEPEPEPDPDLDPDLELESPEPTALVIIGQADEIQLLAPQLFFYRIREIEDLVLFGSEAWTSDAVLQGVQTRHTDGVLAVTTRTEDGGYGPGWVDFVQAYEERFQRTLRSPVPALGYDAARLLIRGARAGGGDSRRALDALEGIEGFPGATGLLSVVDGRIQRAYTPVRIEGRRTVPLSP